jgi:hypothetical protein
MIRMQWLERQLPGKQPNQLDFLANTSRASLISGLPGLSECAQTVSSSPKILLTQISAPAELRSVRRSI